MAIFVSRDTTPPPLVKLNIYIANLQYLLTNINIWNTVQPNIDIFGISLLKRPRASFRKKS